MYWYTCHKQDVFSRELTVIFVYLSIIDLHFAFSNSKGDMADLHPLYAYILYRHSLKTFNKEILDCVVSFFFCFLRFLSRQIISLFKYVWSKFNRFICSLCINAFLLISNYYMALLVLLLLLDTVMLLEYEICSCL